VKLNLVMVAASSLFLSIGCVIKVEVPTSKTKLEKQISGDLIPTEEAVLMRAVTRGQSDLSLPSEISNQELLKREQAWAKLSHRYLDAGYLGWKPDEGLEKVPSRQDDSSEYYEALVLCGRVNQIGREVKKRGLESQLGSGFRNEMKKGWYYFEGGRWSQFGVDR